MAVDPSSSMCSLLKRCRLVTLWRLTLSLSVATMTTKDCSSDSPDSLLSAADHYPSLFRGKCHCFLTILSTAILLPLQIWSFPFRWFDLLSDYSISEKQKSRHILLKSDSQDWAFGCQLLSIPPSLFKMNNFSYADIIDRHTSTADSGLQLVSLRTCEAHTNGGRKEGK